VRYHPSGLPLYNLKDVLVLHKVCLVGHLSVQQLGAVVKVLSVPIHGLAAELLGVLVDVLDEGAADAAVAHIVVDIEVVEVHLGLGRA
jgi:hypothetical protein